MKQRTIFGLIFLGVALWLAHAPGVEATAGFAEWEVRTPGGHKISHVDGFKEEHGDCLRSDSRVWVSHLERWRYYEGTIVGVNDSGFFLFDEARETLATFVDEDALMKELRKRDAGSPSSPWLTGVDGWREAWFPITVWGPCREALKKNEPSPMGLSVRECREALGPEHLEFLRRTTWGYECGRIPAGAPDGPIVAFCRELNVDVVNAP